MKLTEESGKTCADCVYRKDPDYCIRKNQKVLGLDSCPHCVLIGERHSLEMLIGRMAALFVDGED